MDSPETILSVSNVLREQAMAHHRRITDERRLIQEELDRIDQLRRNAQSDVSLTPAIRSLGVDTLWVGWLMERRSELLRKQAMNRVREADSLSQAQTAHSRHSAIERLCNEERLASAMKKSRMEQEQLDAIILLRQAEIL